MVGIDFIGGKPGNYVLGRGKLYLRGERTGFDDEWRDIGNASAFTITQESEQKEHQSFLTGLKTIDLEVPLSTKVNVSFTIDEVANLLNLRHFFSASVHGSVVDGGSANAQPNAAACASDDTTSWLGGAGPIAAGNANYWRDSASKLTRRDYWYDLELLFDPLIGAIGHPQGPWKAWGFHSSQTFTVHQTPTNRTAFDGTLLVENVDYVLDRKAGMIKIIKPTWNETSDDLAVKWTAPTPSFTVAGIAGQDDALETLKILANSGLTAAVRFVQTNPNDEDRAIVYEFFKVKLNPDGDFAAIGDDWATISLTGVAASVSPTPVNASPYGRIVGRNSNLS